MTRDEMRLRDALRKTREADKRHEEMMTAAAQAAKYSAGQFAYVRRCDDALKVMFSKARKNGWKYEGSS